MVVYISGKITGNPTFRENFDEAEKAYAEKIGLQEIFLF